MEPFVPGSDLVLDDAIGARARARLAFYLHHSRDTVDKWCIPPIDENGLGRDRVNPVEEIIAVARRCPNGMSIMHWIAGQLGHHLVPHVDTPHEGQLLTSVAVLREAVENLLTELNRRKPKMSDERVEDLRDTIIDGLHALVADRLERRRKAAKWPPVNRF